jgi:hypothetical protein
MREFVEDGFIKIIFVRITENNADIFTKNVTGELYDTRISQATIDVILCRKMTVNPTSETKKVVHLVRDSLQPTGFWVGDDPEGSLLSCCECRQAQQVER